jgi:hypothetical protein
MFLKTKPGYAVHFLITFLAFSILISACSPANPTINEPNAAATSVSTIPVELAATLPQSENSETLPNALVQLSMDTGSLATSLQSETVPAKFGDDVPFWELNPEHTRVTLQGYPISTHQVEPVIYIYPVNDLERLNAGAQPVVSSLQKLLASPQEIPNMPFLPMVNTTQVMHTHLQFLDFTSGQGLRYLTIFSQGIMPINNQGFIYTYQGLTSDGKYYVAAVLPVTHPSLPADGSITGNEPPEFTSDYPAYVANSAKSLNTQAASTFTPDLAQLDAMMSSIEIR